MDWRKYKIGTLIGKRREYMFIYCNLHTAHLVKELGGPDILLFSQLITIEERKKHNKEE